MSQARTDAIVITGLLLVWAGIFAAAAQGKLHVSGLVSDGLLALLAVVIAYRLWRVYRRWGHKGA
jgi:membrane protein implicated in regulation of membrane protease activity